MIDGYKDAIGNPDADGNTTTDPDWDALNVRQRGWQDPDRPAVLSLLLLLISSGAFAAMSPCSRLLLRPTAMPGARSPTPSLQRPLHDQRLDPSERIVLSKNPNYDGGWDTSKIVSDTITLLLLEDSSAS